MASAIVQAGSALYMVNLSTGVLTSLTLPTGITLSTTRKPRFAVLNRWIVMTNSPSRNLAIDPEGTVRPLVPMPPTHGPTMVASGTGLTGAYLYKVNFKVYNSDGSLLMESPYSPASTSVTLANQGAALSDIQTSPDTISARGILRTLTGGTTYYSLMDLAGNTAVALLENKADTTLSLLPAASTVLVSPPGTLPGFHMKDVVQWKSRLWGISDDPNNIDTIFVSDTNKVYAWPNSVVAYPTGEDALGVVKLLARKNQLGILKRTGLWQVAGSSSSTGISVTNISVGQVVGSGKAGCVAPDTGIVINDSAYWLSRDGVWEWSDSGLKNISNETVKPWFLSDTYFNRNRFANAFAKYNEVTNSYELHMAAAGSSSEDRWVSFNLSNRKWYGPHKTAALTPTHAGWGQDANGLPLVLVGGSDGVLYTGNSSNYRDGAASIIDMDCYGPFHSGDAPDVSHHWGRLSMLTKVESGGALSVTPTVGRLDAAAQAAISHSLTTGREQLRILGDGPLCQLRMQQATVNQRAVIYGYEIDPVFENGKR